MTICRNAGSSTVVEHITMYVNKRYIEWPGNKLSNTYGENYPMRKTTLLTDHKHWATNYNRRKCIVYYNKILMTMNNVIN